MTLKDRVEKLEGNYELTVRILQSLTGAKPEAKTCEPMTVSQRIEARRNGSMSAFDPAPSASPPAWLDDDLRCRVCHAGFSTLAIAWAECPACYDRAQAVPRDPGQPGVPEGWKLGEGWKKRRLSICDDCDAPAEFCRVNPGRYACHAHAEEMGAIVPAEPSRGPLGVHDNAEKALKAAVLAEKERVDQWWRWWMQLNREDRSWNVAKRDVGISGRAAAPTQEGSK